MNHWSASGDKLLHVFYKNNEIAGYAAVLHSLQLLGRDGHYGPRRRVTVFGYGSVSRGAIYALQGRGFNNIHVFTRRSPHLVADQNPDVYYGQYMVAPDGGVSVRTSEGRIRSVLDELSESDIVCNGVLQDPTDPVIFVRDGDVAGLKPRSLIIDISCDPGMGFSFARPTSFSAARCSRSGHRLRIIPSITLRPIYGMPRPGRSRRFCNSTWRSWRRADPPGIGT